jgi:hypothetical protein
MSTNIEQVFDDVFDYTFDLIVGRFMDACEETESAVNEFTCADDAPKRVAEIGEELAGVLGEARHEVGILLASLRQAIRVTSEPLCPSGSTPDRPCHRSHLTSTISVLYEYQADLFKKIPPCGRGLSSSSWCEVEIVQEVWTCLACNSIAPGNITVPSSW